MDQVYAIFKKILILVRDFLHAPQKVSLIVLLAKLVILAKTKNA